MSLQEGGKRLLDVFDEIGQKRSRSCSALEEEQQPQGPLHGVVICLTGLTSDKKSRLHTLVEKLGGRYARGFYSDIAAMAVDIYLILATPLKHIFQLYSRFQH